jgi:ABC-type sugar transport system ATPase subunit
VASHDLEEILAVADRVLVMFDGRIVADVPVAQADPEMLGEAISGIVSAPPTTPDFDETGR